MGHTAKFLNCGILGCMVRSSLLDGENMRNPMLVVINPRRARAAGVTVLGSVCLCVF